MFKIIVLIFILITAAVMTKFRLSSLKSRKKNAFFDVFKTIINEARKIVFIIRSKSKRKFKTESK